MHVIANMEFQYNNESDNVKQQIDNRNQIANIKRMLAKQYQMKNVTYSFFYKCEHCYEIQDEYFSQCPACGSGIDVELNPDDVNEFVDEDVEVVVESAETEDDAKEWDDLGHNNAPIELIEGDE